MCRAYDTGLPADPGLFLGVFCLVFILCVVTVGGTEAFAEQPEIRAAVNCPRHPERCLEAGGSKEKEIRALVCAGSWELLGPSSFTTGGRSGTPR